jgi:hypothetical protein
LSGLNYLKYQELGAMVARPRGFEPLTFAFGELRIITCEPILQRF